MSPIAPRLTVSCVGALSTLLAACAGTVPQQVLTAPPVQAGALLLPESSRVWVFSPTAGRRSYTIQQRAALTLREDTLRRVDSVSSWLELSLTTRGLAGRFSGSVTAFRVQDAGGVVGRPQGLSLPIVFSAASRAPGVLAEVVMPEEAVACSSPALPIVHSSRDLWFRSPDTLRMATVWGDSGTYVTCRDGVPLHATLRRVFRVTSMAERDGRVELTVSRAAVTTIEGAGQQFGETVRITGAGNSELTYVIDPLAGQVVSAVGSSVLDLTLKSRLRSQVVRQAGDIRIVRSP